MGMGIEDFGSQVSGRARGRENRLKKTGERERGGKVREKKVWQNGERSFESSPSSGGGASRYCQAHLPHTSAACHLNGLEGRPRRFITSPRRGHGCAFCLLASLLAS